jgi:general secretion pathway protein G
MNRRPHRSSLFAYTLLEMLVVLGILVLIVGVTAPIVIGQFGNAKSDAARVQVNLLAGSVEFYMIDVGSPPTAEQGLQSLLTEPSGVVRWRGPYIKKASQLIDPWGNPYLYELREGDVPFAIRSLGSDRAPGGSKEAADVSSLD